jgi:hypothetical protein
MTSMHSQSHAAGNQAAGLLTKLTMLIIMSCGMLGFGAAQAANSSASIPSSTPESSRAAYSRLPGNVLPMLSRATRLANPSQQSSGQLLTLTLTLKRDDQAGFDRYLHDVYDPASPNYQQFLTQAELTHRYGPSQQTYAQLGDYLKSKHLILAGGSDNHLTLSVHGTRADAANAFGVRIDDYRLGSAQFYANDRDPQLPRRLASSVLAVTGLTDLARPAPNSEAIAKALASICKFLFQTKKQTTTQSVAATGVPNTADCVSGAKTGSGYNGSAAIDPPGWEELDGTGQTVALIEFNSFVMSDVANYLGFVGAPVTLINNVSEQKVAGGGPLGANQSEVLIDIDAVLSVSPGAKVVVYDAPFTGSGTSFQGLFNAAINGGATIISNSWAYCEDQTTLADVRSIDSILQAAAASGISVFNGAGDTGSTCLDGSANTVGVPADSPNATAVGGTSIYLGPGDTYGSETWWNGAAATPQTGQGGFGVSAFFPQPAYQSGLGVATGRSVPDVVAGADPAAGGVMICWAAGGGCPNNLFYGGTSLAAPLWAAMATILNQALGHNIGAFNRAIYPFTGTSAFHGAASMGSDFAHVGLGSPNLNQLYLKLAGLSNTAVSATNSGLFPYLWAPYVSSPGLYADGQTVGYVNVRLLDTNGNPLGGKTVTLSAASGSHATITPSSAVSSISNGTAVFALTDSVPEPLTLTATDTTDGVVITQPATINFAVPPAANAGISVNPTSVPADGVSAATITVTLKDASGKPTPGKSVSIEDGAAHAVITGPASGVTDANGQIQFSATDQVNETVTFTAIDVTDGNLPVPGSGTVTYSNSVTTACNVNMPPVAASGYTITTYISGFPATPNFFYADINFSCVGADNPAFVSSGSVLTPDFLTGNIYVTPLSGGAVTSANILSNIGVTTANLVIGKDGNWYATQSATTGNFNSGDIVQVNPTTGTVVRVVASNLTCPGSLSVDPLSGDLFLDDQCTGAGSDNPSMFRVIDPSNTNPGRPTAVVVYATLPNTPNGGMAFSPDGTLYAVSGYTANRVVVQISPTSSPSVTVTTLTGISSDYGVAMGATNADGSAQSLIVEPNGVLMEVPIASPGSAITLATVSPGVGVGGPDGCLYSARYDTIYRLANSTGGCTFAPTNPNPSIKLIGPSPTAAAQGTTQTLTATVQNVSPLSGTAVIFVITGANPQYKLVDTDASGNAVLTYTGTQAGSDTITATSTVGTAALISNSVQVTWTAGKHVTYVGLNATPAGGTLNQPVSVVASLTDSSVTPVVAIAGQTLQFTLGNASCSAVTTSNGTASCQLSPTQLGTNTLTATFAGNSLYVAATNSVEFHVLAPVVSTPAPKVTLTVNPSSIQVGGAALLSWSSSSATACAAAGAWSGAKPLSGTLSVTGTAAGNNIYTLACSNGSTTAVAQATLTVTAPPVSVPNVVGQTQALATTSITGADLVVGTVVRQSSWTILPGVVLGQSPSAGSSAAAKSAVNLVVSSGSTCADLEIVKAAFGAKRGQPAYNPLADVNNDGVVNVLDLSMVARALPAGTVCN